MALPLPLACGLALGLGLGAWGCASSSLLSKWRGRGFFLGALRGVLGALGGGVFPPLLLLLLLLLLQLLLLLLPSPPPVLQPGPALELRVHAPRTRARFPPTQTLQHREGQIGVRPQHPAQLSDPHEARPPSTIAPLHAHPAGVASTCLHADNLKRQTKCRCVLAAFWSTVLAAF